MNDSINFSDSITLTVESNHLFYSNKKKVSEILTKDSLDRNDIIDVFVGLHLVLELGINNLFRKIITPTIKRQIDTHEIYENLDRISFIDKTAMFIYYSNFNDVEKATEYHAIIGKLKSFSEIRNKLFHGHSISEISRNGTIKRSKLFKRLENSELKEQMNDFKFILEGLGYYLDCLESNLTPEGKSQLKNTYLDYSFIPEI